MKSGSLKMSSIIFWNPNGAFLKVTHTIDIDHVEQQTQLCTYRKPLYQSAINHF